MNIILLCIFKIKKIGYQQISDTVTSDKTIIDMNRGEATLMVPSAPAPGSKRFFSTVSAII